MSEYEIPWENSSIKVEETRSNNDMEEEPPQQRKINQLAAITIGNNRKRVSRTMGQSFIRTCNKVIYMKYNYLKSTFKN